MRYINQFIISSAVFLSSFAHAADFYAEALYWQASESVDWALTNNLSLPNQVISYKTINFNFTPGFRIGAGLNREDWSSRLVYTRYNVQGKAKTSGNVISAFMPSKFAELFYKTAEINHGIDYNIFDLDFYKTILIDDALKLNPLIGFKGGWINQKINANYQGRITALEAVKNDFSGLGPKAGIESRLAFYENNSYKYSLAADFSTAFMWGNWSIKDRLTQSNSPLKSYVKVGRRDFGSLEIQGLLGINLDYKHYSFKIAYEISDWFNQYQVFDNAVGTHTNDLILQGLSLAFNYRC